MTDARECTRRFEEAWDQSLFPQMSEFLPERSQVSRRSWQRTLIDLAKADMERRWNLDNTVRYQRPDNDVGLRPLVEDYVKRFPELEEPHNLNELVVHEFSTRLRTREECLFSSWEARFPEQFGNLEPQLRQIASEKKPGDFTVTHRTLETTQIEEHQASAETIIGDSAESTQESLPEIDGYEIAEELGHGGMGVVYRARDWKLNRDVAIKLMKHTDLATSEDRTRFEREARSAARLSHRNIVPVFEFGYSGTLPFFAMEYVPGQTLQEKITDNVQNALVAAEIVKDISLAVGYAHDNGIVHRDLKPANVLIDESDVPRITDFGLARGDQDMQLTATEAVMGTPSYMSPEQAAGRMREVGRRSDIYSIGAIFYACLTGVPPHKGENHQLTLMQVLDSPVVSPRQRMPTVPRDAESICLKCLSRLPEHRYTSASELVADLDRFLDSRPVLARPRHVRERVEAWTRRNVAWLTVLAVFVSTLPFLMSNGNWMTELDDLADNRSHFALLYLDKTLESDPRNSAVWFRRAQLQLALGNFAESVQDAEVAESLKFRSRRQLCQLMGEAKLNLSHWNEADRWLSESILIDDHNPDAFFMRGRAMLGMSRTAEAISDFSAAIECRPDFAEAFELRAKARRRVGDSDAAKQDEMCVQLIKGQTNDSVWQQ
jgi:serine/threonine protein kinase